MQYGFLIDQRRCIGCHACTVACKSENEVPVASFRTWVKYEEKGTFPEVRRHFAVLRCNHCTKPPCVTICPVNALEKSDNGIVDLDRDACIGCRACMQACPYDALYLNEDSGAVEKCHFCAHRVEQGQQPACVVVCPEQAIVPGDLHDDQSRLAAMVRDHDTEVRRPEQNTGPNVHYLGHLPESLKPGTAARPEMYLWSDRPETKLEPWPEETVPTQPDLTTVLDAGHKVQWGSGVALYVITKGVAAGVMLLAPFVGALNLSGFSADYLPELLALLFLGLTTFLLVHDLTRPMKFLSLFFRGNPKSWLVKGGYVLTLFGMACSAALVCRFLGADALADQIRWVGVPLALLTAGYTAFLFQQCEGRDLWQSGLLLPQLLFQALLLGAAWLRPFSADPDLLGWLLCIGALGHLVIAVAEWKRHHPTDNARQAAAFLGRVRLGSVPPFQFGLFFVLLLIPLALLTPAGGIGLAAAGLFLHEWAVLRAGQLPPLS